MSIGDGWKGRWLALALGLATLGPVPVCAASFIEPGEVPELGPDEGLVVVALDTEVAIAHVVVDWAGSPGGGNLFGGSAGQYASLYRVKAGRHAVTRVELPGGDQYYYFDLRGDSKYGFDAKAGELAYPGDFVATTRGARSLAFDWNNRSATTLVWLRENHPELLKRYPMRYTGGMPDPFPAFASTALHKADVKTGDTPLGDTPIAKENPDARGIAIRELYRPNGTKDTRLNPAGDLVAELFRVGSDYVVNVIDPVTAAVTEIYRSNTAVETVAWENDRTLIIEAPSSPANRVVVVHLRTAEGRRIAFDAVAIPYHGTVIDMLPKADGKIVFARVVSGDSDPVQLHKVIVSGKRISQAQFKRAERLDRELEDDSGWLFDADGNLRVVSVEHGGRSEIRWRPTGESKWTKVRDVGADDTFVPVALAPDGVTMYAITDVGRTQQDLVAIDLTTPDSERTVSSSLRVDVRSVVTRPGDGEIIGVRTVVDGELRTQYLEGAQRQQQKALEGAFRGQQVIVVDTDRSGDRALVLVTGPTNPGAYYFHDAVARRAEEIGRVAQHLDGVAMRTPQLMKVKSRDGLELEALLTLPAGEGKVPLVVMPHGGPLGVQDRLDFDRPVQWLASRGFGVLQVNYRGSGGFGSEFLRAGYGQWGKAIEDDIESALDHVVAQGRIDPDRVCIVGSSYGGYSALMAIVRAPQRFRCAASMAGVTDLPLMFSSSDWSRSTARRNQMMRMVGDPASQLPEMQAVSPVYQFEKMTRPLLLIHGTDDQRVTLEHSIRLQLLLAGTGNRAEAVYLGGQGHGAWSLDATVNAYDALAVFLDRHLREKQETAASSAP